MIRATLHCHFHRLAACCRRLLGSFEYFCTHTINRVHVTCNVHSFRNALDNNEDIPDSMDHLARLKSSMVRFTTYPPRALRDVKLLVCQIQTRRALECLCLVQTSSCMFVRESPLTRIAVIAR
uniref:Uncharacterized protein n=1 Tax=Hyaloperonospora arabidopsidis (strain Emoy2) TaxID=559515 RepID=M4BUG9_HYAAE